MKRIWVVCLLFPLALPARADIKIQRKPLGRIEIRNALRRSTKPATTTRTVRVSPSPTREIALKIRELATRYGLNESLVRAVARAESGFNPYAVSHKGAVGIMQLMPETAKRYGVKNRFNSSENLEAGIRHLKYLSKRFNGTLSLILAAYNSGEEAVRKHNGIPPYRETREYVRRVLRFMGRTFSSGRQRTQLYKVISPQGRILITNTPPPRGAGKVERLK